MLLWKGVVEEEVEDEEKESHGLAFKKIHSLKVDT